MTVSEMLAAVLNAYPGANPDAISAFRPVFFARFGKREGPHLQAAFEATLAEFKPKYGQPFPIPADFERHLPSLKINTGKGDGGPAIDLPARKRRADSLFASWQAGQCRRADKGNPLLRRALENTARQLADVMGWQENPEPLVLTHAQLKTACQSALSIERRARYGQPPKDKDVWWQQLSSIASEWGVQITPEWWDETTGKAFAKGADDEAQPASRVMAANVTPLAMPPEPSPAMKIGLLKAAIRFHREMGFMEAVEAKERELAQLEAAA